MEIYRTQIGPTRCRYLILTDPDPKTSILRGLIADVPAQTVRRVPSIPALLRAERWQTPDGSAADLDTLVRQVPALRRYRGVEVRLPSGITAWLRWRQWSSADAGTAARLMRATQGIAVPAYEPDGDYFLAAQAVALLGGEVLDPPRSSLDLGPGSY